MIRTQHSVNGILRLFFSRVLFSQKCNSLSTDTLKLSPVLPRTTCFNNINMMVLTVYIYKLTALYLNKYNTIAVMYVFSTNNLLKWKTFSLNSVCLLLFFVLCTFSKTFVANYVFFKRCLNVLLKGIIRYKSHHYASYYFYGYDY